jgi:hypothetical protein
MAAGKTVVGGVQFHVTDLSNNHITLAQTLPQQLLQVLTLTGGGAELTLSKQNVLDLLAPLTAFANSGVLT